LHVRGRTQFALTGLRKSRPCLSERSVAESNFSVRDPGRYFVPFDPPSSDFGYAQDDTDGKAPSKAKVESRANYAQDDTQGRHLSRINKRSTDILVRTPFYIPFYARYSRYVLYVYCRGGQLSFLSRSRQISPRAAVISESVRVWQA